MSRLVAAALIAISVFLTSWTKAEADPSVLVRLGKVQEQLLAETLVVYGQIQADPDQVLSLSLPHAGLVGRVWVRLGQRLKSGDKLLELYTSPGARMQFVQARSAVDYAQRELARQQRLQRERLTTTAQVEAARKALRDAESRLKALRQLGQGESHRIIRSPMDGILTQLDVKPGQRVPADTTALLIAAERQLTAQLGVEPEDLGRIKVGSPVRLRSVFVPDYQVDSTIREVHAMINPATHLVDAIVPIPPEQADHLVLGGRMRAEIQLEKHRGLVVPRNAVLQDGQGPYVFVIAAGKAKRIPVVTGVEQDALIEIVKGVQSGDLVVVSGNYELHDGMPVREGN